MIEETRQNYIDFALNKTRTIYGLDIKRSSLINMISKDLYVTTTLPEEIWNIIRREYNKMIDYDCLKKQIKYLVDFPEKILKDKIRITRNILMSQNGGIQVNREEINIYLPELYINFPYEPCMFHSKFDEDKLWYREYEENIKKRKTLIYLGSGWDNFILTKKKCNDLD